MGVVTRTTHTANCPDCRWYSVQATEAAAVDAEQEHRRLHDFKVGDEVHAPRSASCRWAVIRHLYFDQDRAVIEASPRREVMCYSCPNHDVHPTGQYVTDQVPISSLELAHSGGDRP